MKMTVIKVCALFLFVTLVVMSITSANPIKNNKMEKYDKYYEAIKNIHERKNKTATATSIKQPGTDNKKTRTKEKIVLGSLKELKNVWNSISTVKYKGDPLENNSTKQFPRSLAYTTTVQYDDGYDKELAFEDLKRFNLYNDFKKIFVTTLKY